jgi:hypothetical protein
MSDFGLSKMEDSVIMATSCGTPSYSHRKCCNIYKFKISKILSNHGVVIIKIRGFLYDHSVIERVFLTFSYVAPEVL